jgi:hypothetical protein
LSLVAAALALGGGRVAVAVTAQVSIEVVDEAGVRIPARMRVVDSEGRVQPPGPDPILLSHGSLGGYFYGDGLVTLTLPTGPTTVAAGRGFEWEARTIQVEVSGDTLITLELEKRFDMRSRGWFSGDVHAHTQHPPIEYYITPEEAHRVARAEDLSIMWCLDQDYEFTGAPHAVSDDESIIYYSTEYRNQAYGHVSLLGLKELMDFACCWPGSPASPMLSDLYAEWSPAADEGIVLVHPHNTDDFWDDVGWPGNGLGRELPVMAALGTLAALDLAAYSNEPDVYLPDWHALLNSGMRVPASAGTDAVLNAYWAGPPGGYRVYVLEGPGGHDAAAWVDALKSGRTFVTNYPLLPVFTVNGEAAGSELEFDDGPVDVTVRYRIECGEALGLAKILVNGNLAHQISLPSSGDGTVFEREEVVTIHESGWIGLLVYGSNASWHAFGDDLFAYTSPVYVRIGDEPARSTFHAGRMLDWIDDLETFVLDRGHWSDDAQRLHVLTQIDAGREPYLASFIEPPGAFDLLAPGPGDTVALGDDLLFDWSDSQDPEMGDRLHYVLRVGGGSDGPFGGVRVFTTSESELSLPSSLFTEHAQYWWRVDAVDRAGNATASTPDSSAFYTGGIVPVDVSDVVPPERTTLTGSPNPVRASVYVRAEPRLPEDVLVRIVDVQGRSVLHAGGGGRGGPLRFGTTGFVWDTRDDRGRPVAGGRYWIEVWGRSGGRSTRVASVPVVVLR